MKKILFTILIAWTWVAAPASGQDAAQYSKLADSAFKEGKFEEALNYYTKSIEIEPKSGTYFMRGNVYMALKKHKDAEKDFSKAIALVPENPIGYHYRGECYRRMYEYEKAERDFTQAIKLKPVSPEFYFFVASPGRPCRITRVRWTTIIRQ